MFYIKNKINVHLLTKISLYLTITLCLCSCTNLLFHPYKQLLLSPDYYDINYDHLYIPVSNDIKLHAWHLPASRKPKATIIFFHGNGGNISTHLPSVYWLPKEGYEVYMIEYRGYGHSEGEPDLHDIINDSEEIIQFIISRKKAEENIIVMGHSFGGTLGIYSVANSAYKNKIKAIVSIEAFSDYRAIARDIMSNSWFLWLFQWPLSFTINNDFSPLDSLKNITPVPLVVLHSKDDEIIPFYHAELIFMNANEPKYIEKIKGKHNNTFAYKENKEVLLKYLNIFSKIK